MTYYRNTEDNRVIELTHSSMPAPEWEPVSLARGRELQREQCIAELRALLVPGDTVHTVLRHVSSSGMLRCISLIHCTAEGPQSLDWLASHALGNKIEPKHGGLKVSGCGMDMGFHLVYSLGRVLWPEGFALPEGKHGRNGDTSGHDNDGGYALTHRWI